MASSPRGNRKATDFGVQRVSQRFPFHGHTTAFGRPATRTDLWDNRKIFLSDLELSESIVKIKDESVMPRLEKQHAFFKHPEWAQSPEIYFKWGIGGYELGMEVQQKWWEKHCKSGEIGELAKTKTHEDYLCGTTRLEIATLPYSEFGIYYDVPADRREEWEQATCESDGSTDLPRQIRSFTKRSRRDARDGISA